MMTTSSSPTRIVARIEKNEFEQTVLDFQWRAHTHQAQRRMTVKLNTDAWLSKLEDFFSEYEEFTDRALVLDESQSFDDVLVFDIVDFCGEVTSDVTTALDGEFAGAVAIGFRPDMSNSRRKIYYVTVRRPPNAVLRSLQKIYSQHDAEIQRIWQWKWLLLFLLFALLATGHAAFLLHTHLTSHDQKMSVIGHFILNNLSRFYLLFFAA